MGTVPINALELILGYTQELLGHKSFKTTEIYTHGSQRDIERIKGPLDFGTKSQQEVTILGFTQSRA